VAGGLMRATAATVSERFGTIQILRRGGQRIR
jgi:hypothetical protein